MHLDFGLADTALHFAVAGFLLWIAASPPPAVPVVGGSTRPMMVAAEGVTGSGQERALKRLAELGTTMGSENNAGTRGVLRLDFERSLVGDDDLQVLREIQDPFKVYCGSTSRITDRGVDNFRDLGGLKGLTFPNMSDDGMKRLQGLTGLEELDVSFSRVSDAGLVYLPRLMNLRTLLLVGDAIGDPGLENIAKLAKLQQLDLYRTRVSDVGLVQLTHLGELRILDLSYDAITDLGLGHIARLQHLESLGLKGCGLKDAQGILRVGVSDAGLRRLEALTRLRSLELDHSNVTDACMASLGRLPNLRSLSLYGTKVTGSGLQHLGHSRCLEYLNLHECNISDAGLGDVERLPELRVLLLGPAPITNQGLAHVAHLTKLQQLSLMSSPIDDAGLQHLGNLVSMARLDLSYTGISDAGLRHLISMKHLVSLDLNGTKVTEAGVNYLRQQLPQLMIGGPGSAMSEHARSAKSRESTTNDR